MTTKTRKKIDTRGWKAHRKYEPLSFGVMGYSDEFLCPHGIGHDMGTHGCDGCCSKEILDVLSHKKGTKE